MPFTFSWMLHGNDEGEHDGGRQIAVNWVMPWDATQCDGAGAFAAVGNLMWPWRFVIEQWWAVDDSGLHPVATTGHSTAIDRQGAYALLEAELRSKCVSCPDVFSTDIKHMWPGEGDAVHQPPPAEWGKSSLPHVFVPLTHLPAILSQDVLGMVRQFQCEVLAGNVVYVPQFHIDVNGRAVVFTPANSAATAPKIVTVGYTAAYTDGQTFDDVAFSVVSNFADNSGADDVTIGASFHPSEVSEVGARVIRAALALSPMVLLGKVAGVEGVAWPANAALPQAMLSRALGPGLLRMEDGKKIMFWERLPGASASTGDDLFDAWTEADSPFDQLKRFYDDGVKEGSNTLAPLKPLFEANTSKDFAKAAGVLLDHAADARVLMLAWLAATAFRYSQANPSPFWVRERRFADWYALLGDVIGEHEVAELLIGWWRYWLVSKSGSADPRAGQLHTIMDGWIRGDTEASQPAKLGACCAHAMALLASSAPPSADLPTEVIDARIVALHERLRLPDEAAPVSLAEDADLAVVVATATGKTALQDEQLRGYAIAMAAGFKDPDSVLGIQWVTDLACKIKNGAGKWVYFGTDEKPQRMHDTVGATSEKGRSVVAFQYNGSALSGAMLAGGADSDGVDGLKFGWYEGWPTPQLAYGLRYWARATPVGNGGKILDPDCKGSNDRSLKDPVASLFDHSAGRRYLCRVAPGAITIKPPSNAYDMEGEARGWHEQADLAKTDRVRVAVIRPKGRGWRAKAPTALEMELVAPDGTPKVIERWLNADIAQRKVIAYDGQHLRDPASKSRTDHELLADSKALLDAFKNTERGPHAVRKARHPAARAIGVEVIFFDGTINRLVLTPVVKCHTGYMEPGKLICKADAVSTATATGATLTLTLAPGASAKLKFWTLAPEAFFAVNANPVALARMANFASASAEFKAADGTPYRAFGEREHWFECAPDASDVVDRTLAALEAAQAALAYAIDGNDAVARIGVDGGVDATWLKGFLVQRYDWHWSGYPLALPRMLRGRPTLLDWSEAFAGTDALVETRAETLQTVALPDWRFGLPKLPAELCRTRLPGLHGARFVACVLRPLRRFDAWLENAAQVEDKVLATGRLVAARVNWSDPALRLAPPTVMAAVPLVRTYEAGENATRLTGNGTLLCLEDALCRTDAQARFGGVGEIVDVDLEETRINNVFEIGPNPIMHAGPVSAAEVPLQPKARRTAGVPLPKLAQMDLPYVVHYNKDGSVLSDETVPMDWRLEVDRPFGLTFDADRNPKVAHTAIIVRPVGAEVATYWVMAKVRLRRLLDPGEDWTASGKLPGDDEHWLVARRPDGDDRIPFDFAICDAPQTEFALDFGTGHGFSLPARVGARRLLCSWHKGHWKGTSEALWGLQVLDQVLAGDGQQWKTVERYSPYETAAATGGMSFKDPGPVLLARLPEASAQRLLLSDYGQAHWLTFIGTPFRHTSIANEDLTMKMDHDMIELWRSGVGYGVERISRDLLLNPVTAGDTGRTPGSERVAVEKNTFHLLLVFERVNDIAAPPEGNPLGQLAGVYKPTRAPITETEPYPPLRFKAFMRGSRMPQGAVGYIYKFQSTVSSDPIDQQNPDSWEALLAGMFPSHQDGEATVRWLPEFAGPILTGEPVPAAALKGSKIRIDLGAKGKIVLEVEHGRGWKLKSGNGTGWQDGLKGGPCTLDDAAGEGGVLAVEGAGGRLLARLHHWSGGVRGKAVAFDDNGVRAEGEWNLV